MGSRMGRWFILVAGSLTCLDAAQATANSAPGSTQAGPLSFEFFKIRVQPIFLKERQGHARCYGCHTSSIWNRYPPARATGAKSNRKSISRAPPIWLFPAIRIPANS